MCELRKYQNSEGQAPFDDWLNGLRDHRAKAYWAEQKNRRFMASLPFNVEDYLNSPEDIAAYLDAVLEDGDERVLLLALRDVAKAKCGIASLAEAAELNRESLYKALSKNGNPRLDTLAAVLKVFGLRLSVTKAD